MFKKSKSVITENIKKNSYVKDVEVSKKLNGTLTITVTPRDAEYLINYAGAYIYIDSEGYLLEVNSEPTNIPILIGITTDFSALTGASSNSLAIDMLNENDLEKLKTVNNIVQSAKENSVYSLINTIDITDEKNYTLHLDSEGKTVYLGDCKDINTRILYLKAILEKESGNSGEVFINADLDTGYVYFKESN
jgi:type II secretory pathway component GspD/PulD (secretin)